LIVDDAPLIQDMRIDAHGVGAPPRVHPGIP
jgi:hypothetical protein